MNEEKWIDFGEVGVDSGQLIICDPCYIKDEWENEELIDKPETIIFPDGHTEKVKRCSKRWFELVEDINNGKLKNKEEPFEKPKNNFSYPACCEATREKQYGQLNYKIGHAGVGVAFSSGLGDGVYKVQGKIEDVEGYGERVTEVRIKLI